MSQKATTSESRAQTKGPSQKVLVYKFSGKRDVVIDRSRLPKGSKVFKVRLSSGKVAYVIRKDPYSNPQLKTAK